MNKFGLSGQGGPITALAQAKELGLTATQFFTAPPQKFTASMDEVFAIKEEVKSYDVTKVAHASLVANLSSSAEKTRTFTINSLAAEMKRCMVLGVDYIVAHPGSCDSGEPIETLANSLKILKERMSGYGKPFIKHLCLETMPGSGNQLLSTPEGYRDLYNKLEDTSNIFICIDTAHIWGAGYSPMEFWTKLSEYGLTDKVKVVHLNNTLSDKGSKKERHAELSAGVIPQEDLLEFVKVLNSDVIMIEEQPSSADANLTAKYLKESVFSTII